MTSQQSPLTLLPALRGDSHGRYKVHIVGNSGVGKSTLGKELAEILGVPFIPLDELFWQPGWVKSSREEFAAKVRRVLDQESKGWVIDGDYFRRLGDMVDSEATDHIWLNPPLLVYFPRLIYRTFLRLLGLGPQCSPGCQESWKEVFFSKNSILWWCLTNHAVSNKREAERMRLDGGVHNGGRFRPFGGWGSNSELTVWKSDVRAMIASQRAN